MMRPRFRLRTLLILTALAAAACYWWVGWPSMVARRFTSLINAGNYTAADALSLPGYRGPTYDSLKAFAGPQNARYVVRIQPLTWDDILDRQRRIEICMVNGDDDAIRPEIYFATPSGVWTEFGVIVGEDPIYFNGSQ